ncbi:MAG TPA: NAD-dependent epimerase/dehydratase family protein [Tepidisphaeraceae bacterium]|jgi:nucleoside-diphosphate-sugar epimerase|nr:NAD-dependent epimerase/dehydratase family protein [Tepidisphaeraceae bacterium]
MARITDWRRLHGSAFEGREVLVTGGAGFIGSHLAGALDELGATVTVLDDLSAGGDPKSLPKNVHFVLGSILDDSVLQTCCEGRQLVFHQAALGSVPQSIEQPARYQLVNSTGTLNVLEAARKCNVPRVMFAASSSAYGDSPVLPKTEAMPTAPRSPYAATKVAGEAMAAAYSAGFGIDTVSLRYFNIFGPRQRADSAYAAVIAAFAKAMLGGKRPSIFGDGEQSRDFTYVDNAVHANLLAAKQSQPQGGAIINVACGVRITVNELAARMAQWLKRDDLKPNYAAERAGDVKHSVADVSLARRRLGYEPIVDFATGLGATMQWYREALGG